MADRPLTDKELDALRRIDTATVANAIDFFAVRPLSVGYSSLELRCLLPELPPMVGYAVTCTGDSTSTGNPPQRGQDRALYEAIRDSGMPVVVVCQNVGIDRLRSNQFGDIMATTFQRLGAVGSVTDGGIRDLAGIRERAPGFQMFAAGAVAAAGISLIVEVGLTISICGMTISPGDLLHGDANGLVSIPQGIAAKVAAKGQEILDYEQTKVAFLKSPEFSLEELVRRSGW